MKRLISVLILAVMLLSSVPVLASDVTNAIWQGEVRVTSNKTSTAEYVAVPFTVNSTAGITQGWWNSTITDIAMLLGGTDYAVMPGYGSNPWLLFVDSIGARQNIDYNFYAGNVTGGKIRYFGTMTIDDDASMEPGDNFSIVYPAWFDTDTAYKTFAKKAGAFWLGTSAANEVSFSATDNSSSQTTASTTISLYSGAATRAGERFNGLDNLTIREITFWMDKAGSPTGTANVTLRKTSDDSLVGMLGSIDVSTLGGPGLEQKTFTDWVTAPNENFRILVEYSGGDAGNYIRVGKNAAGGNALGWYSYYSGSYTDDANQDAAFSITYNTPSTISVTATGISSGEQTITASRANPFNSLGIDSTGTITPVSANVTLNAPVWQSEEYAADGGTFTTIDGSVFTASVTGTSWAVNDGYTFDGGANQITIPASANISTQDYISVEAWYTPDAFGAEQRLIGKQRYVGAGDNGGFMMKFTAAGAPNFDILSNGVYSKTGTALSLAPHHLVGVYDGSFVRLYVDGAEITPATAGPASIGYHGGTGITISQAGFRLNGTLHEFRIYTVALSAAQVLQNYNATKSKYTTGDIYTYSSLTGVPDTANDIVVGSDAVKYIEYYKQYVGGNLVCDVDWEYTAGDFTDASGNGNDATPTYRTTSSDANVSADLISFSPVTEAKVSTFTLSSSYSILTGTPTTPSNMFADGDYSKLPAEAINDTLDAASVPRAAWWLPFIFLGICVIGLTVYGGTTMVRGGPRGELVEGAIDGSLVTMCIVIEILLFVLGKMGPIPLWPAYIFPIGAIAIVLSKKHLSWG